MSLSERLEHLIERVKGRIATGEDSNVIIDMFVEMSRCSPEEAVQLREHFAPPVEQFVPFGAAEQVTPAPQPPREQTASSSPAGPVALPAPPPLPPQRPEERTAPILQIDWGTELKPDVILSPIFTIQGGSFQEPPLIYFPIDSRIAQNGWVWNETPCSRQTPNGWEFHQDIQLERAGQYRLNVTVLDRSPGFDNPACYQLILRINVTDPEVAGQRRKLTIQAHESAVVDIDDFPPDTDISLSGRFVTFTGNG